MTPEALMRLAIDKTHQGIAAGQTPFGCAIALGEQVVAVSHNCVHATTDITAHAEIVALREACKATGQIHLEGALVAATCEPCPMCMAALHWARVETVVYGATIADAESAGFNELAHRRRRHCPPWRQHGEAARRRAARRVRGAVPRVASRQPCAIVLNGRSVGAHRR